MTDIAALFDGISRHTQTAGLSCLRRKCAERVRFIFFSVCKFSVIEPRFESAWGCSKRKPEVNASGFSAFLTSSLLIYWSVPMVMEKARGDSPRAFSEYGFFSAGYMPTIS
jgi:hypothetical protein